MKAMKGMFKLFRNMQLCVGVDNCESRVCVNNFPDLRKTSINIAAWAMQHNIKKIEKIINDCPVNAIQLSEIKG